MRILIIGGDGMLGHQLLLSYQNKYDVKVTLRQELKTYQSYGLFNKENSFANVDIKRHDDLIPIFAEFKPQIVINAVGIVKQRKDANDAIPSLEINALFPHKLALLCEAVNARFIHISTDCVFNGKKGFYNEDDSSDAEDLYGKSKYLGEVSYKNTLTIRSSIIGLELSRKTSLIEWFLAQKGEIKGFRKAIYSGLTTVEMARVIENITLNHPELYGLWHVSSEPINKYDLLTLFSEKLGRNDILIHPDDNFFCERSLSGDRFRKATGYKPPSWDEMLTELAQQVRERNN